VNTHFDKNNSNKNKIGNKKLTIDNIIYTDFENNLKNTYTLKPFSKTPTNEDFCVKN
jgi:hypothetical protein